MWNCEVVWSLGDLTNDDYLQQNKHIEQNKEDGSYFETCEPRFWADFQIDDRIEHIDRMIERLQAEKEHLKKYGYSLVGITSYEDVVLFP